MSVSVVIPTLNEEECLGETLWVALVQGFRLQGSGYGQVPLRRLFDENRIHRARIEERQARDLRAREAPGALDTTVEQIILE